MVAEAVDLDRELDRLFATVPEAFVGARDALVKRLRAEKRREDAAQVAALRRPHRLVWALDQLHLDDDPSLPPLLAAVAAVRAAKGEELRDAGTGLREAVNEAAGAAARRLQPPRPSDRADLAAALHTIVGDEEALDALAGGRLLEVPEPSAFGYGFAFTEPAPKAPRRAAPAGRTKLAKAKPAKTVGAGPDPLAVKRAQREARAAAEAEAAARAARDEASTRYDVAAGRVDRAEDLLEEARQALDDAQRDHDEAVEARDHAAAALAEADGALHRAEAAHVATETHLEELQGG